MRVFVTGASGHIGSALVPELLGAGHQVVGLARSDASAAKLITAGAEVQRGTVEDLDTLRQASSAADGVVHLAFDHQAADWTEAAAANQRAIEAIGAALEGTGKPFVVTSGTLIIAGSLPAGQTGTEDDAVNPTSQGPRNASEITAAALAQRGVRSSVVRLAPTVHSYLDLHGFIPTLIQIARAQGYSAYVADGTNRWPAVNTLDAANLFRLALEMAPGGSRWHGAAEEGVPFRNIAEAIGRHLGVPAVSIPVERAQGHFGFLSIAVPVDNPTSSTLTRERLGWTPVNPGLLEDIEQGHYFQLPVEA
jgi:nucleoside-diphosphate-sugar epimerase